jgi:hypothetical protein
MVKKSVSQLQQEALHACKQGDPDGETAQDQAEERPQPGQIADDRRG